MPMPAAAWMRIWWVRPVSGVKTTIARPSRTAATRQWVTAALPAGSGTIRQPVRRGRGLAERQIDRPRFRFGHAVEHRDIGLGHLLVLEGALEGLVRLGVAGEQQAARRVAVEPVDRQRQPPETETKMVKIIFEALGRARSRMDGEAGRLVDHQRLAVDEKNAAFERVHGRRPATCVAAAQRCGQMQGFHHINTKLTFCLHTSKG